MFMKTFLSFLLSLTVGISLFALIIYFIGWGSVKEAFLIFSSWRGMLILGLTALAFFAGNWRWQEILKGKGTSISFFETLKYYLAGFSVMFLAPVVLFGGEILRSYSLKEKNGISWQKSASSVLIDRIIELTSNVFVIFPAIVIFFLLNGLPSNKLAILFFGVPLSLGGIIFIFYFRVFKKQSLALFFFKVLGSKYFSQKNGILNVEKETFDFFKQNKKIVSKVFVISFIRCALTYSRVLLILFFLGIKISWLSAFSILGFTYLALLIPIPAALGSHELVQASAFNYFGISVASAAVFTMIIRGAELIVSFFGIIFLFKLGVFIFKGLLFRKLKGEINNGNQQSY